MAGKNIVLIATKNLSLPGGVTNFYRIIKNKYNNKDIQIEFFYQGVNKKHDETGTIEYLMKYIKDLKNFRKSLKKSKNVKLVQLNPSLYSVPIIRDFFYIILSKIYKRKVIIMFHGWGKDFEKKLLSSKIKKKLFCKIYNKADLFYVLSQDFKLALKKIGIEKKIKITRTTFDGDKYQSSGKNEKLFRMIYLGRLQREKGIFTILKALNELKMIDKKFIISFIGWFVNKKTQKEFNKAIELFDLKDYIDVQGYVSDEEKIKNLVNSDIFVFPTYYPEGCPTVVIEALAAGLFVVTTDTAALKEIIEDKINGIIVKKNDYNDLKSSLEWCFNNMEKVRVLGKNNRNYAFENFESAVIIDDFYKEYKNLINY